MQSLPQNNIFKYITIALVLASVGLIAKEVFFSNDLGEFSDLSLPTPTIDIKVEIFDKFDVNSLTPFDRITSTELIGRENPFEPYSVEEYQIELEEFLLSLELTTTATTTLDTSTTTIDTATTTLDVGTTTTDVSTTTQ